MPDFPSALSRSGSTSNDAEQAGRLGEQQEGNEFAQQLGSRDTPAQDAAGGLQERLATLRQQAPNLPAGDLRNQVHSLGNDLDEASDRLDEGHYLDMMNGLRDLMPRRAGHADGAQPQVPIGGSRLATHRATVDVAATATAGGDVDEAVARAVRQHGLGPEAADGPDGRSGLRLLARQGASGGLVRADDFDMASARAEVRHGQDPEQVAARNDIVHPDDVAVLNAEPAQEGSNARAGMMNRMQAHHLVERGAAWETAARDAGVTRADGSIHPEDRDELQAAAQDVAAAGGPRADANNYEDAEDLIDRGVPWQQAAQQAQVTRPDGSINPDDRAELQARAEQVAASGGPRAGPEDLNRARVLISNGVSWEAAARQAGVTRPDGSIHLEDQADLQGMAELMA